jgi:hypothetical protein
MEFPAVRYRDTAQTVAYRWTAKIVVGDCEQLRMRAMAAQKTTWSHMDLPSTTVLFLSTVIFLA